MPVIINRNRGSNNGATLVLNDTANATYVVAGNDSVSNVTSTGQTVTGAVITQVWASAQTGAHWTISRGSNVVAVYTGSVHMNYAAGGAALNQYPTANLVFTLNGGTVGSILTEIKTTN